MVSPGEIFVADLEYVVEKRLLCFIASVWRASKPCLNFRSDVIGARKEHERPYVKVKVLINQIWWVESRNQANKKLPGERSNGVVENDLVAIFWFQLDVCKEFRPGDSFQQALHGFWLDTCPTFCRLEVLQGVLELVGLQYADTRVYLLQLGKQVV